MDKVVVGPNIVVYGLHHTCLLPGRDLPGHPEGQVEPRPLHLEGVALHLLAAV